jgi:ADP-ribose pyrophosphatase
MEKSKKQAEEEKAGIWEKRDIYQGRIISVRSETLERAGKTPHTWDLVIHPGAVVILPITFDEKILLVKQWRRAAQKILIELPAGTLEHGESPAFSAQRELQEETGYRAEELTPLGGFFSAPGFCTEYLHLFLARNLVLSPLDCDENEAIDLLPLSLNEALRMIDQHLILDAKTIAGILLYTHKVKNDA